jgi:NitT/TauT family transport system permease protein
MPLLKRLLTKYWLVCALLALWELSGRLGWVDQAFLPSLSATLGAIADMWAQGRLFMHISASLFRVSVALTVAAMTALPLAWLLARVVPWAFPRLEALFRIFALVNPYCLFPLFVVFLGAGEPAKVCVLAWVSFWPVFFSSLAGIRGVDPLLVRTAESMGAGRLAVFWKAELPAALPSVFSGLRIGVGMSFFILIAAEMTGAVAGLGWIVHSAGALNQVPRIYGTGVFIVLLGVFLNRSLEALRRGLFFWKEDRDPVRGAAPPGGPPRALGPFRLAAAALGFALILIVGAYEIHQATLILNDPSAKVEYRVWFE